MLAKFAVLCYNVDCTVKNYAAVAELADATVSKTVG